MLNRTVAFNACKVYTEYLEVVPSSAVDDASSQMGGICARLHSRVDVTRRIRDLIILPRRDNILYALSA